MKQSALFFFICFLPTVLFGEGTKELRPAEVYKGNLLLLKEYTDFGLYNASSENQIKIRIGSPDETIYLGLNNKEGSGGEQDNGPFVPDVPFRIVSPSGVIVYESVMPPAGEEGHINTWTEAVNGPRELGNSDGYDAIQIDPDETGDYVIEFNPEGLSNRLNIHLFDITVTDVAGQVKPGRLHSQGWQISAEQFENPFYGTVYPYDGKSAVYEVDFNGINPLVFVINFNSTGTESTGDFIEDRKSKVGPSLVPEYEVFLNPPDESLFPVEELEIELSTSVRKKDCISADLCLDIVSDSEGYLDGYLDFNNNGVFDEELGEVWFSEYITGSETKCIGWDGYDTNGNLVSSGNFNIITSFGFGVTHLPLYDAEHSRSGYKINIIRPENAEQPLIFWDDSYITDGTTLGDRKVNLEGCNPVNGGCHLWENRGAITTNDPNRQETINTWWFSRILYDTLTYYHPVDHQVELSFDPQYLIQNDTSVCKGDSLNFYVYNNENHFDLTKYAYEWTFNGQALTGDVREQKQQINDVSTVVVKATDTSSLTCISYDTLRINVVDPVRLQAVLSEDSCGRDEGTIRVDILSGPPDLKLQWLEFPDENSNYLDSLPGGIYHLHVEDSNYSKRCALDTSFVINKNEEVLISEVETEGTLCYDPSGKAAVKMNIPDGFYYYSWDNGAFSQNNEASSLQPGEHSVLVKDIKTGCSVTDSFTIPSIPLHFNASSTDDICNNGSGQIRLNLPDHDFAVYWNNVPENVSFKTNLEEGTYDIRVSSTVYNNCSFDTLITIDNPGIDHEIRISYDPVALINGDTSICIGDSLSFYVYNNGSHYNTERYSYEWHINNSFSAKNVREQRKKIDGVTTVVVKATDTSALACYAADTIMVNVVEPVKIEASTKPVTCINQAGEIDVTVLSGPPNVRFYWQEFPGRNTGYLNNIEAGTYHLSLKDVNFSDRCALDTVFTVIKDDEILVSKVEKEGTVCYDPTGWAQVFMEDQRKEYEYSWDGGVFGKDSVVSALSPGIHKVVVRNNETGCDTEKEFEIPTKPLDIIAYGKNEFCNNGSGKIDLDLPDFELELLFNGVIEDNTYKDNLSAGTYHVVVNSLNYPGCSFDTTITLENIDYTIDADFEIEKLDLNGERPSIALTNLSGQAEKFYWDFGDSAKSQMENPRHTYADFGSYLITLKVLDSNGCPGFKQRTFDLPEEIPCGIRFPNAFSPNGDHINNTIGIIGNAPKVELKIFNRWGEVIFRTFKIEERWDGTYRGKESPVGAYPFILDWECPDVEGKMVKHRKVGDVTLVR